MRGRRTEHVHRRLAQVSARSALVITNAPAPSVTRQQSSVCSGDAIGRAEHVVDGERVAVSGLGVHRRPLARLHRDLQRAAPTSCRTRACAGSRRVRTGRSVRGGRRGLRTRRPRRCHHRRPDGEIVLRPTPACDRSGECSRRRSRLRRTGPRRSLRPRARRAPRTTTHRSSSSPSIEGRSAGTRPAPSTTGCGTPRRHTH